MITHVSFSGGGIKGICYLGILRYMYIEKMVEHIRYVSGSSIGAFFATVLALKMPVDVLEQDFVELLKDMNDNDILCIKKSSFFNLFEKNAFFSVRFMMIPIIKYLKHMYDIEDITFLDFVKKTGVNLYVNTTNVNTTQRQIFSAENTPNASVIEAVVASMSVPIMFEPVKINGEYYVDGVLSYDMPMDIFSNIPNHNKLGILLMPCKSEELQTYDKDTELDFMNYFSRISLIMMMNLFQFSTNKYKDKDNMHILKLTDLPYDHSFKFVPYDDSVKIEATQEEIDNLILKGFIDMSNFMQKRASKSVENSLYEDL